MAIDELFDKAKKATLSTVEPYLNMTRTGQKPAGQFRVKWMRYALVILWWSAAISTGISFCIDLAAIIAGNAHYGSMPGNDFLPYATGFASSLGFTSLIFDLWVAASLRFLAKVWKLRAQGLQQKTKIWHIVAAIALILGRPSSFLAMFLFSIIPNNWWILWPIKFGLIPPVVLLIAGAINIFSIYIAFTLFILGVVLIPLKIFESLFKISNALFLTKARSVPFFGTVVSFWYWFTGNERAYAEQAPDDSKGARFAIPKEIESIRSTDGAAFGYVDGRPLFLNTDKHILIMASTRSGKGVSLIIPHLLRYQGSAFVLDPKGENARATGRQRAILNHKVHYLDPFGLSGMPKARFNPLSRMTPENMEAESKALAAALILTPQRDHWTASAQQLLAAVILHVFTSPNIPPEKKDLITVRRLLLSEMTAVLREMLASNAADGLLSSLAASFSNTPDKEYGSILSTAQRETEILDNPYIAACLSASGKGEEVNFADWHKGTMTVYLCLSAPKFPVFNRWLRLVLTAALDEMTDNLAPPPLPVCFMLDELATLGHLQTVENAIGLAAGYGIQLITVFQDVAQLKDLYKGRWASFIGNAGVRALFNLDDFDTAQYWSHFLGGHLVETTSLSQGVEGLTTGQTKSEAVRPLLTPEEIMLHFAQNKMLVLSQGTRPIIADRVPYFKDQALAGLWDDPREGQKKTGAPPVQPKAPPSPVAAAAKSMPAPAAVAPKAASPVQPKAEAPKVAPAVATPKPTPATVQAKPAPPVQPNMETAREKERQEHQEAKQGQAAREQAERGDRQKAPPSEKHAGAGKDFLFRASIAARGIVDTKDRSKDKK